MLFWYKVNPFLEKNTNRGELTKGNIESDAAMSLQNLSILSSIIFKFAAEHWNGDGAFFVLRTCFGPLEENLPFFIILRSSR